MKDIVLALVARSMFVAHSLVGVWRAERAWDNPTYWFLLIPVGVLVVEALFTIGLRGGDEFKWLTPCVILYLAGVIPSIWLLELKNFQTRDEIHFCSDMYWGGEPGCGMSYLGNVSEEITELFSNFTGLEDICLAQRLYEDEIRNISLTTTAVFTTRPTTNQVATTKAGGVASDVSNTIEGIAGFADSVLGNVDLSDANWVLAMHQLLLFILIIGRWLLPTGEGISRDQLSQLLLVFIGIAADILEFVTETVKEITVRCDYVLLIVILGFWSWSMVQFTLVLSATKARKTRMAGLEDDEDEEEDEEPSGSQTPNLFDLDEKPKKKKKAFWKNMEVWGIMSTLILQDGPFLSVRLYVMIGKEAVHQMIIFFTCKNLLIVILQVYRLVVIGLAKKEEDEENDDDLLFIPKNMDAVRALALAKTKFSRGLNKSNSSPQKTIFDNKPSRVAPATNGNELPMP